MKRLRVGIGRPTGKTSVDRHVLGRFSSDERKVLDSVLVQSVDLLLSLLSEQQSQSAPKVSSSPAGGRHAAQKTRERSRSASPAEDSAAAQSWSCQTLLVKRWHGRKLWWDFIYSLVSMKVAPHNQEQRFNKVVNYSSDEFHHFWRVINVFFTGWRGTFLRKMQFSKLDKYLKWQFTQSKLPIGHTQDCALLNFTFNIITANQWNISLIKLLIASVSDSTEKKNPPKVVIWISNIHRLIFTGHSWKLLNEQLTVQLWLS